MAGYAFDAAFSSRSTIRLYVSVTTTEVAGGTELYITAEAQRDPGEIRTPFNSSASRTYSVPGGRTSSTSGTVTASGSATWSYDFSNGDPQAVWGGFNRYIPFGSSSVTVTISALGGGVIGTATASMSIPLFSAPPFFPPYFPPSFPFFPPYFPFFPPFFPPYFPFFPPFFPPYFAPVPVWSSGGDVLASSVEVENTAITQTTFSALSVSTYALFSGSLPSGVSLSSTGLLSGTPVEGSAGTYNFVVSANGDGGSIYTGTLTMTVQDNGGDMRVYNSTSSQWEQLPVYVYNGTSWVRSYVYVYNSGSTTWDRSI